MTIQYISPINQPSCPKCRNGMQNAVPYGSPMHRRCASCKHVWGLFPYVVLEGVNGDRLYKEHNGEKYHYENCNPDGKLLISRTYTILAYVDTHEEALEVINGR